MRGLHDRKMLQLLSGQYDLMRKCDVMKGWIGLIDMRCTVKQIVMTCGERGQCRGIGSDALCTLPNADVESNGIQRRKHQTCQSKVSSGLLALW